MFSKRFTLLILHEGTVLKVGDKGATVALAYGVEAFGPNKHMVKEDGKPLKADEKAMFKVIEFSKDQRKIVVSHSRIHEEKSAQTRVSEGAAKDKDREDGVKAVKKVKESVEKTTLGDIGVLSNLKNEMEAAEKKKADDME